MPSKPKDLAQRLAGVELLRALPRAVRSALAHGGRVLRFRRGGVVFGLNDPPALYVVLDGRVTLLLPPMTALIALLIVGLSLVDAATHACEVEPVSVNRAGSLENTALSTGASTSGDGRLLAFESSATDLVPDDTNNVSDVFVRDRITGVTTRVSVDSAGNQPIDPSGIGSGFPSLSGDGRLVAFQSDAVNLVAADTNGVTDVFVHDLGTGITERVSVSSTGVEANDASTSPSLSADGRYLAFTSLASNLAPGGTLGMQAVFVHDRLQGTTEVVAPEADTASISGDGRFVAFASGSTNLVPGDTNSVGDVFVRDRLTGQVELESAGSAGEPGNAQSFGPSISADGRVVAFMSFATNLVPGDASDTSMVKIFMRDRETQHTQRVAFGVFPSINADGRFLAFAAGDIFVFDRVTQAIRLVSSDPAGNAGDDLSTHPSISADGLTVAFDSRASNFAPGGIGGDNIFVSSDCAPARCAGDCDGDGIVTVPELVTGATLTLGGIPATMCPFFTADGHEPVIITDLVSAINVALNGCNLAESNPIPYRLIADSSLTPPGSPPQAETLTGTCVALPTKPLPPNTLFDLTVEKLRFRSGAFFGTSFAVDGGIGRISATPQALTIQLTVTINGQPVELTGSGSAETFTTNPHPTLTGLKLSGGGYEITLSALPEL